MRLAVPIAICLLSGFVPGCGSDDGGSTIYDRIDVEPAQATLTIGIGGTATQDYQVFGVRGDKRVEITNECVLSVEGGFGTTSARTVTVNGRGGKTTVNALCPTGAGTAQLIVLITGDIVIGDAPQDSGQIFDTAMPGTDPARMPGILYPLDKAVSPVNIPSIDMQWTAAGNDLFHVSLRSSFLELDVYTTSIDATLPATDWDLIARTASGDSLAIAVEGLLRADPVTKYGGPGVAIAMSKDNIDQTAIYWWASSAGSIMTQVFGKVDAPDLVKDGCTSCHSLSRAGTRLGYSRCVAGDCGQLYAGFLKYDSNTNLWGEAVYADAKSIAALHDVRAGRQSVPDRCPISVDRHAAQRHPCALRPRHRRADPVEHRGREHAAQHLGADGRLVRRWHQDRLRVDAQREPVDRPVRRPDRDDGLLVRRRRPQLRNPDHAGRRPDHARGRRLQQLLLPELLERRLARRVQRSALGLAQRHRRPRPRPAPDARRDRRLVRRRSDGDERPR
ncbi:MAG: hypothetical protein WKG01_03175 [Kofleriaceae bacterium]